MMYYPVCWPSKNSLWLSCTQHDLRNYLTMNSQEHLHPESKINFLPHVNGQDLRKWKTAPASKCEDCIDGLMQRLVLVCHVAFPPWRVYGVAKSLYNWFEEYLQTSTDRTSITNLPDHTLSNAFLHNRTLAVAHPLVVTGTRHNCEQAAPVCAPIRVIKETRLQPVQTGWIIPPFRLPQLFLFYWQWGTESEVRRKCGLSVQKYFRVTGSVLV